MNANAAANLWERPEHAHNYLGRANSIPHRTEGEATLLEFIPRCAQQVLDLGTGDGRLLALVKGFLSEGHPALHVEAVTVDFSPTMLAAARAVFGGFFGDSGPAQS